MRIITLAALLPAPLALAQDAAPAPDGTPEVRSKADFMALDHEERRRFSRANRPPVSFFIEGGGQWSSPADLDDASGDVEVARLRAGGGLAFRLDDSTDLILRGTAEFSFYDFSGAAGLIPGAPGVSEPFDDLYEVSFSPMIRSIPDEGWQWFVGGSITSSGEPDADFGDTITGGGLAGASYSVIENLRLGAGVAITTRLEGGVWVFPIPLIQWDITRDLSLRTVERGLSLEYWLTNSWNIALQAGFERREYRLADDNSAVPGGSVTDRRIPVALAITYTPSPKIVIAGRVGSEVWGDLEFHDRGGSKVTDTDLGSTFLVGLDIRVAF